MREGLRVVQEHLARLEPLGITGAWLHGSLALGGYHHGISDQDLVVGLSRSLTGPERALVARSHAEAGPLLSAAYVVERDDPARVHPTWTHGWSGERRLSLITRAELHQAHPQDWPEVPDLPGVVAREVTRVWRRELRVPATWLRTEYVDLSLTSLVRALLTQETGRLTGKDEAIAQMARWVPQRLSRGVAARRAGQSAPEYPLVLQAWQARQTVRRLLGEL